jgi:hypothetical protein
MQTVGMTRRHGQDTAIKLFGFRQLAGLMILGGSGENLRDLRRRACRSGILLRAALLAVHTAS